MAPKTALGGRLSRGRFRLTVEGCTKVLAPLRMCAEPIGDAVGPTPYTAAQSILDETYAKVARNYRSGHNFIDLPDPAIDALVEAAAAPREAGNGAK